MCMNQKHHYDRNRKAVQQGLDRRREEREEAAQEAAGQAVRDELRRINQRREAERVAAEDAVCRRVAHVVEETNRKKAQASEQLHRAQHRRDLMALEAKQLRVFLILTFCPLLLAAGSIRLYNMGLMPFWVTITWTVFASIYSVWNFVAYATRNIKKGE